MPTTVRGMLALTWHHPANRGRRARAFAGLALWQLWKRAVGRPFDLRVYDGMRFRAHRDSTAPGRFVYFGGLPDFAEMTFMQRYLRPGDGFIDGGASEGMYTLLAAKLAGPTGEVHAFEPAPEYVARLRANVHANRLGNVVVHSAALGERPGRLPFVLRGTGSRLLTPCHREPGSVVDVEVVRLDEALPDRSWAMGKLDVEGAEHQVLAGASALLARHEPAVWMLELVDRFLGRFGSSIGQVRDLLGDHGYELVHYDPGSGRLIPAVKPRPNALAVSRKRRPEVITRLR